MSTDQTPETPSEKPPAQEKPKKFKSKADKKAAADLEATLEKTPAQLKSAKTLKTKRIKQGALGSFILFLIWIIYMLFVPYKGGMTFGVCKVFLELYVPYPSTLRLSTVDDLGSSVRIWYTHSDSFGQYQLEPIQCFYREDPNLPFALDRVTVRRRELDAARIETFNHSLPTIFANPPDLSLPWPLEDSLKDLQLDTHLFARPIF